MKQLTKILVIVVVLSLAVIWYTRDSRRPNSPVVGNGNVATSSALVDNNTTVQTTQGLKIETSPIAPVVKTEVKTVEVKKEAVAETKTNIPEVVVSNQKAGMSVSVDKLTFSEAAWVTIREEVNGVPRWILGAAWFPAGVQSNLTVDLLRPTEAGKSYYAELDQDVAPFHAYDYTKDTAILGVDGKPILVKFNVSAQ